MKNFGIFLMIWIVSLVITYNFGKERHFKEGQDFIAFTSGENRDEIINEIRNDRLQNGSLNDRLQKELSVWVQQQREYYEKTHR